MTALKIPPLEERKKPGLSATLHFFPTPDVCQSCGSSDELVRWRECDEWDQPTMAVVVLCAKCSRKLIEKHPRMYHRLQEFEPFPGSMTLCMDCPMREGVSCKSPIAKHNGGAGMRIDGVGSAGFFCPGGYKVFWHGEAKACTGKEAAFTPHLV